MNLRNLPTGILTLAVTLSVCSAFQGTNSPYFDADDDIAPGIFSGNGTLDILGMEVTNNASDITFTLSLNGNISTTDWGKFMIGFSTGSTASANTGNGWARPINLNSPIGGMDYWIGSWVNGGGGAELYSFNGVSWALSGATYSTNSPFPGSYNFVGGATSTITYTATLASLGLAIDDIFYFDAYSSGGGDGDSAVDALANPNVSITNWGGPYTSSSVGDGGLGLNSHGTIPRPPPPSLPDLYVGSNTPSNTLELAVGTNAYARTFVGFSEEATNNTLIVRNAGTVLSNSNSLTVGENGSGNQMVVTNGATVFSATGRIGVSSSASNNAVLVTGAGSLWSNSGTVTVGGLGTNNSLTVANGGAVAASGIILGLTNGSSGILNIGRFGQSDAAGTINTPTIAFGTADSLINLNQTNTALLSSSISGAGAVFQNGTGTTILTGLNTYNGPTVINNGILQVGNGGATGSVGSGNITNNGQLTIDLATNFSLSSAISGTGSLYQNGTGTTILTGLNTYSGVSVINAGTLQIGNGGTSGTIGTGDITNNSRLVVNRSDIYVITNNIYGTGELIQIGGSPIIVGVGVGVSTIGNAIGGDSGLTKAGNGTLILTSDNTYTGTTTIAGGTLQLGDETPAGSTGPGTIVNNATLAIKRNNNFVLGNFITGSGQLRHTGSGTTVMTGSNNYTGPTAISSGALVVNGSASSSSFVVEGNGVLSGHGSVGSISGSGLVDPGDTIGILRTPSLDASGGLDFRFEFTSANPNYAVAAASANDLLRLSGANPFASPLNSGNQVDIYFNMPGVGEGSVFTGAFFTDQPIDFASSINGAAFNYYVADAAGGTIFGGNSYSPLDSSLSVSVSSVLQSANFSGGPVNGSVARFEVVPEPSTYALLAMTAAGALWFACRRRA
jgi:autotransporter-associated beta strand protein/T5SS/PEP-CTERM-associated repeat protein